MQETLTTEIYNQIDCMKLHLRNLQEVAEIEKLMPVSCEELHKGIAEMEKALVHLMNFEKLLKAKSADKHTRKLTTNQQAVLIALTNAAELTRKVLVTFHEDFLKGVSEVYKGLYCKLSQESCHVFKKENVFGFVYGKEIIHLTTDQVADLVIKVKPAL